MSLAPAQHTPTHPHMPPFPPSVSGTDGARPAWSLGTRLARECACCLASSTGVQACLLRAGGPTCLGGEGLCACDAHACEAGADVPCVGVQPGLTSCGEGRVPLVSFLALEQVHILIFVVALTHVACSFFLHSVARARIRLWRRWPEMDHERAALCVVRAILSFAVCLGGRRGGRGARGFGGRQCMEKPCAGLLRQALVGVSSATRGQGTCQHLIGSVRPRCFISEGFGDPTTPVTPASQNEPLSPTLSTQLDSRIA